MGKRTFSIVLTLALVAGVFSALPAKGQEVPVRQIPAIPNITDDASDANGLTPQGGPAGGVTFSRADILAGWFSVDADSIYAHVQTTAGGRGNYPYLYRVRVDPGTGTTCLWFTAFVPSAVDPSATRGQLRDTCGGDVRTEAELIMENGPEDPPTGVFTIKVPRAAHPSFADGSVLAQPMAEVTQFVGTNTQQPGAGPVGPGPIGGATAPTIDMTENGLDYTVGSSSAKPTPEPGPTEEPGKEEPKPGKGKGCKKGKGKKKGCKPKEEKPKPPVVPACPAYVPGEEGAEAETTVVTDAATEEKPVELTLHVPEGIGVGGVAEQLMGHGYANVQVNSANPSAGLFVRLEMPIYADYDLYVNNPDGEMAARAAGFNPEPAVYNDDTEGGHTEQGAEVIDGLATADCQGYTIDAVSASAEGGDLTLKYWLGEPAPAEPGQALSTFFALLGL